ncbi:hypothetical protein SAMN04488498_11527 [Mesorhizobium albiziae]|uniref:ParG protein n=1 Tax=Neomesorhizobium albiziae TaxID=335020 RepID=A0A1I4CYC7_9HYPH|nr:hypothetical protein [Mesorhizobium albiziae]GLS28407.1 hypothetical protein GCM10007937_01140 [Mesorhizobium albiziae]SFK86324.1 hypothetical protein SAMN04488498_11527 [Mesorhizobium albiziae]
MSSKENISLDEFLTAPRKQTSGVAPSMGDETGVERVEPSAREPKNANTLRQEARKALRQVKRERVKGESHFVNVNLDRETKRRLKLASFNAETSMQAIMERAIVKYLDDHGL